MKSLRILIASSFLLTACSLTPQEAPTTPVTSPTPEQEEATTPSEATTRAELFLVDLEDNGANGTLIGCGDSLVSIPYDAPNASGPEETFQALLDSSKEDPETGLYNALAGQNLRLTGIVTRGKTLIVDLEGQLLLGGVCDAPRIEEQLKATFLSMDIQAAESIEIYLNGIPLKEALSSK